MKGKRELDQVDVEAINALTAMRGWHLYRLRIAHMLETALRELEQDQDHVTTTATRAKIRTLRAVAAIPDILLTEAKRGEAARRESEE